MRFSIVGSFRDQKVACSVSKRQSLNFDFCVWRAVSSHSSHHPQEVLLAQFSQYVYKSGLKPNSFHFVVARFIMLINKYNGVFYGRDEPYFVCTHSTSSGDRHRDHAYVPGKGDTVMT